MAKNHDSSLQGVRLSGGTVQCTEMGNQTNSVCAAGSGFGQFFYFSKPQFLYMQSRI